MHRIAIFTLTALPILAQDFYPKRITVAVGRAVPAGTSAFDPGTLVGIHFSRRYTRNIQADAGLETAFNQDYRGYIPRLGTGLTTNTTYIVPVGGRIVVPLWDGRIEPSFGLGGVYAYDQRARDSGHQGGIYGIGGLSYALDSDLRHRVGLSVRYINIMSAGRPHPQWVNVFGEYSYNWGF